MISDGGGNESGAGAPGGAQPANSPPPALSLVTWAGLVLLVLHPCVSRAVLYWIGVSPIPPLHVLEGLVVKLPLGLLLLALGVGSFWLERRKDKRCRVFSWVVLAGGLFWGLGGFLVGAWLVGVTLLMT